MQCRRYDMWKTIKGILPDYILLNSEISGTDESGPWFIRSGEMIERLAAAGAEAESVYADVRSLTEKDIFAAAGKCRFVAGSLEELQRIDRIARDKDLHGRLPAVGLRLIPAAYDSGKEQGIRESELARLSHEIRKLSAISVRGCFVEDCMAGLHGKELGRYFRYCYELAKRMSVILPCAMPYICIVGGGNAVEYNLREHSETLAEFQRAAEIVAMQNNTAFYAKLLLA